MKRDVRLPIAIVILIGAAALVWIDFSRTVEFFLAYDGDGWRAYAQKHGIDCKYDCYPGGDYGLYAILLFLIALALLLWAWWKPKK